MNTTKSSKQSQRYIAAMRVTVKREHGNTIVTADTICFDRDTDKQKDSHMGDEQRIEYAFDSPVRALRGYQFYAWLAHLSDEPGHMIVGPGPSVESPHFGLSLQDIEAAAPMLRKIQKRIDAMQAARGNPVDIAEYFGRACEAAGIEHVAFVNRDREADDYCYTILKIGYAINHVRKLVENFGPPSKY